MVETTFLFLSNWRGGMHKDWMHIDTSTRQYATDTVNFIKSCGELLYGT